MILDCFSSRNILSLTVNTPTVVLAVKAMFFAKLATLFKSVMLFKICLIKGCTIFFLQLLSKLVNDHCVFVRTDCQGSGKALKIIFLRNTLSDRVNFSGVPSSRNMVVMVDALR